MSKSYDPRDWYWIDAVGGRVYASARQAVVTAQDAEYRAFIADGTRATPWPMDEAGRISDDVLCDVLDEAGARYGVTLALPTPAGLGRLKSTLKTRIDDAAEAARLTLITPGSGQAMEYQEAYAEAVLVRAALSTDQNATFDLSTYPMLAASIGCDLDPQTGKPTTDVAGEARSVIAAYGLYQQAGAAIRGARLKGKAAIDAAATIDAAQAAFAAIAWPSAAAV